MAVKIIKPKEKTKKSFCEIMEGEFFLHNDELYIKLAPFTENENSFNFEQRGFSDFIETDFVLPVDVEITVLF